jgi:hypothetical protein
LPEPAFTGTDWISRAERLIYWIASNRPYRESIAYPIKPFVYAEFRKLDGSMKRLLELDALRGLAALMVPLYHPRLLFGLHLPGFEHYLWSGPLHILVAGPEAVILFFVLSGFVLALPIVQRKQLPYHAYLIRRICRIYLP